MKIIAIATREFDIDGYFVLTNIDYSSTDILNFSRRASKTAILDGDVYVSDFGYSAGDKNLKITLKNVSLALLDRLTAKTKLHSKWTLAYWGETLKCNFSQLDVNSGKVTLTFLSEGVA